MAKPYVDMTLEELAQWAVEYLNECISNKKEMATNSGKVIEVADRHIPTVDYFLTIWLPIIKERPTISRETYYNWLELKEGPKFDTIKKIDDGFRGLATDIVANEGKGIFYAKNRLGMTDRTETTVKTEQPLFPDLSTNHSD